MLFVVRYSSFAQTHTFLIGAREKRFDDNPPPSDERQSKPTAGLATLNVHAVAKSERRTATNDLVLRNRSRADVRVGPRAGADAVAQVRSGAHSRAAGGAGASGKSFSNGAGRRHQ